METMIADRYPVKALGLRLLMAGAASLLIAHLMGWVTGLLFFPFVILLVAKSKTERSIPRAIVLFMFAALIQALARGIGETDPYAWMMAAALAFAAIMEPL